MTPTETLAAWMLEHGFATGHADTHAELLAELAWQVQELRDAQPHHGPREHWLEHR